VNLTQYPLVTKATIWEEILKPGDIIFVPGGAAHQVCYFTSNVDFCEALHKSPSPNAMARDKRLACFELDLSATSLV
jgi:hypothetical protein